MCCPRTCGVNRLEGEVGFCRIGAASPIAHAGLHFGEEPPISGSRGSGTIFFVGCNLRCLFCQNSDISQGFGTLNSESRTASELAAEMLALQEQGAHNINFVSPSHMIFQMADAIQIAKKQGLNLPVVYNSGGYDSVQALRAIRGLVDIYLPDLKYMDSELAVRLSFAKGYVENVISVLEEMLDQVGILETDADGIATGGLLVRHLVLPGQLANSQKCLDALAALSPYLHVSLMSQYSPRYHACDVPDMNRPLSAEEYNSLVDYAADLGMEHLYIQHIESQTHYLPDFQKNNPFES